MYAIIEEGGRQFKVTSGATVTADVIGEEKGPKIDIVKYKRRKGYHKKIGHRQTNLRVKITGINV